MALGLGAAALGAGRAETWNVAGGALVAHGLLPLLFLLWMLRRGEVATIEVRQRARRTVPYLFGIACVALFALALAIWLPPPRRALALIEGAQAFNTLVLMLINFRWKISLHLTALAATLSILAAMAWLLPLPRPDVLPPVLLMCLMLLLPLLAWARVYAGAHTWAQTAGGTLFGLLAPAAEIALMQVAGVL